MSILKIIISFHLLNFRPILHKTMRKDRSQTLIANFSKVAKCQSRHSDSQADLQSDEISVQFLLLFPFFFFFFFCCSFGFFYNISSSQEEIYGNFDCSFGYVDFIQYCRTAPVELGLERKFRIG